jgi:hypothetical protein
MIESNEFTHESAPDGGDPSARAAVVKFVEEQAPYLPEGHEEPLPGGTWAWVSPDGQAHAIFHVLAQSPGHYFVTSFDRCAG